MKTEKWFYKQQENLHNYLTETYKSFICNHQDVSKNRVHENYTAYDKDGKPVNIQVVIYKSQGSVNKTRTSIFEFKECI